MLNMLWFPTRMLVHDCAAKPAVSPWMQGKRPYGEVLRGVRGGVQDVAVKRLMCSADGKLEKFVEVRRAA
jgi:hypothetical protein